MTSQLGTTRTKRRFEARATCCDGRARRRRGGHAGTTGTHRHGIRSIPRGWPGQLDRHEQQSATMPGSAPTEHVSHAAQDYTRTSTTHHRARSQRLRTDRSRRSSTAPRALGLVPDPAGCDRQRRCTGSCAQPHVLFVANTRMPTSTAGMPSSRCGRLAHRARHRLWHVRRRTQPNAPPQRATVFNYYARAAAFRVRALPSTSCEPSPGCRVHLSVSRTPRTISPGHGNWREPPG